MQSNKDIMNYLALLGFILHSRDPPHLNLQNKQIIVNYF